MNDFKQEPFETIYAFNAYIIAAHEVPRESQEEIPGHDKQAETNWSWDHVVVVGEVW